jgi:site-specific recombinase XerD
LADYHPGVDLVEITRQQVEEYLGYVIKKHSPSTGGVRYRSLQQLFKWMITEELIKVSPMAGMALPTVPVQPVPVVSMDDLRKLIKTTEKDKSFAGRRDVAMIRLFLEPGGMRLSELTNLPISAIDLLTDAVVVLGKGGRSRVIPFGARTGSALTRYLRARTTHAHFKSPRLWLGSQGPLTRSGVGWVLQHRCDDAGIERIHPHQLRHSSAHYWLQAGGSESDAMRLFGWRSKDMLARYGASLADERAQDAARKMALGDQF